MSKDEIQGTEEVLQVEVSVSLAQSSSFFLLKCEFKTVTPICLCLLNCLLRYPMTVIVHQEKSVLSLLQALSMTTSNEKKKTPFHLVDHPALILSLNL